MNCQEYREMIEDYLDFSRTESPPGIVQRHLEHCPECRAHLAACQASHVALFRALNGAYDSAGLPPDFADRLVAATGRRRRFGLPTRHGARRWAVLAASLAIVAGFVFAATVVGLPSVGSGEDVADGDECEAAVAEQPGGDAAVAGAVGEAVAPSELPQQSTGNDSASLASGGIAVGEASPASAAGGAGGRSYAAHGGAAPRAAAAREPVSPPYGAASSFATDYVELDARAFTRHATSAIALYTVPRGGIQIIVF